jgi:hypothetical protein
LAQNWVIGGGAGLGGYRNGTVTSPSREASAGIRNGPAFTAAVTEDLFDHFAGEFRYLYHRGDSFVSQGAVSGAIRAQSHSFLYDALIHCGPRSERIRPFVAAGAGARYFDTTGAVPSPQPLPKVVSLATRSQWKPMVDFGAGVKLRLAEHVVASADFRDMVTPFPDRLFSLPSGASHRGMLHQFTPLIGLGYRF